LLQRASRLPARVWDEPFFADAAFLAVDFAAGELDFFTSRSPYSRKWNVCVTYRQRRWASVCGSA
jgi:hypothetical protein